MLILSPSKGQDFTSPPSTNKHTTPLFTDHSLELIKLLHPYSLSQLCHLMNISEKLADLNIERYKSFNVPFTLNNAKQAIFAFTGDVYRGIEQETYSADQLEFAQNNLRIISGLYGLLRPLDLIQPYRLEMKTNLQNRHGKNLYAFWGTTLADALTMAAENSSLPAIINLASIEYSKAIPRKYIKIPMLDIAFKEIKGDSIRSIAVYAKRARGLMTNYIIKNKITTLDQIKQFADSHYKYSDTHSNEKCFTFIRPQP